MAGCRYDVRSFGLTLIYTGCRLSEALELTGASLQSEARLLTFRSLKKRDKVQMREVPVPPELVSELSGMVIPRSLSPGGVPRRAAYIWQKHGQKINRATGYRWIKSIMAEAGIVGAQASPKGLRQGYSIHAVRSGVQLNMLQRWMEHATPIEPRKQRFRLSRIKPQNAVANGRPFEHILLKVLICFNL